MVIGTAERQVQIFNLTNPATPFKVCSLSFERIRVLTERIADYAEPSEVANKSCLVLPSCEWFCSR